MNAQGNTGGGIGFGGALALLFIGLKLGGAISWSWWWVLSPLWIPLALVLVILVIAFVVKVVVPHIAAKIRRVVGGGEPT